MRSALIHAVALAGLVFGGPVILQAAELIVLDEQNWEEYAPVGKEVDAIYGDYVLRNDKIVAVVAQAVDTRHANLTVRNVGGCLIDLALRDDPSDQLSAFYPHGSGASLAGPIEWSDALGGDGDVERDADGLARLAFRVTPQVDPDNDGGVPSDIVFGYELKDGANYLTVISKITNSNETPIRPRLRDGVRADGEFQFGFEEPHNLWWAEDRFWRQAYGIQPVGEKITIDPRWSGRGRDPRTIRYTGSDDGRLEVPPQGSIVVERRIFPAANSLELQSLAATERGTRLEPIEIDVQDPSGAVADAQFEFRREGADETFGFARTNGNGQLAASLPVGRYQIRVHSHGREAEESIDVASGSGQTARREVSLPACGFVDAEITNEQGEPIPCRVAFLGQDGTPNPDFGPDSAIYGVRNLQHTPNGRFHVPLLPGRYQAVITRGPEYDAVLKTIEVEPDKTVRLQEKLIRTVDTTGWLSADFHSHSSPSGDNTSSQRGRVLNLLAEHVEFAPCTEHNRISTYVPHLRFFKALDRMATCCGIELTGQPLPLNHQNAFPLVRRPRTQNGGGPTTHVDPVVQIERLAMWDDGSDKLVQINHPNIVQMVGDRDLDGVADGGFERMLHYMDVMEVHPPGDIFRTPAEQRPENSESGNRIFNWLQLLNLGYRVPGVVNTDAHWNYYGSGGLRNYVRSSTDDPGEANIEELVGDSERGHIVMTNGPFLEVEAQSVESGNGFALPGDDVHATDGKLTLNVRVQCPNWMQVNRVQVFVNGRPLEEFNYTRRRHPDMFGNGPVVFDQQLPISLRSDAHLVVAVAGEGTQLGIAYGPPPQANEPDGTHMPVAVANPIYVDVDGNGFQPNGDSLDLPLPVAPGQRPSHGHDHANFHEPEDE